MRTKQKALILDYDDTCVAFTQFLMLTHNRIYGTSFIPNDIRGWDLPKELNDLYKRFENNGLYNSLPVLPGVREVINHFKMVKDYKIIILTARPEKFGECTYLHLITNDIKFDELIFEKDKVKAIRSLSKKYHIAAFIDDKLSTIESVAEKCRVDNILMINMPHNQKEDIDPDIIRVDSIFEAIRFIK